MEDQFFLILIRVLCTVFTHFQEIKIIQLMRKLHMSMCVFVMLHFLENVYSIETVVNL